MQTTAFLLNKAEHARQQHCANVQRAMKGRGQNGKEEARDDIGQKEN
jgi:hypothetical protein